MSQNDTAPRESLPGAHGPHVLLAVGFEAGLAAVALAVGWLCGHWPLIGMFRPGSHKGEIISATLGLVAAIPPLVGLWVMDSLPWNTFRHLRALVRHLLAQLLGGASRRQLLLVALAAGVGEELLFRGLIQAGLKSWIGPPWGVGVGLVVGSLLFGACHWLSTTYALLATGAGLYFGLLMLGTGSLWTPLVAHAVYDFIALVYLLDPRDGRPRGG